MEHTKDWKKRAVLVIDNDPSGAEVLEDLLVKGDYQVYTAGSLNAALKIVREQSIDVALLALGRPGFDFEKHLEHLQSLQAVKNISIIVILENFAENLIAAAIKAGAANYLIRPVDTQELIRKVGVYAHLHECRMDDSDTEPSSGSKSLLARLLPGFGEWFQSRSGTDDFLGQHYQKIVRLGIGSFGEVWKVKDVASVPNALFVAKIPLSKKLNPKIEKEARILKMLAGHAGVPKIQEIIDVKKKKVLIQEFVEGRTLFEVMERELEDKETESVVIQLMDVVAYAHDFGIIHRDIKPGNVIIKPDGSIKLLDYGAAKELKDNDISCTVTGSRPYMSPEQIMGKSQRRSDVWALGVVMYVLYTGMFPFYHDVEKVLMDMILEMPFPAPRQFKADMDPQIEDIILKCLEKDPEKRFPDAGALKKTIMDTIPGFGARILQLY
jgi:CheY-like chemotaxis protein